jgi:protein-S-isoprenylcysteine O-methyltransferase Ste14
MREGTVFRVVFWILFGGMIFLQIYFSSPNRWFKERTIPDRRSIEYKERWPVVVRLLRSISLAIFLLLFATNPASLDFISVPFSDWLRWVGGVLGFLSLAFYSWARATLGHGWSSDLKVDEGHQLITAGPYTWIRHPIYLSLMGFMTGIALVTANWFLIAFLIVSVADLIIRIPKEEKMMIERFGDDYEAYMQRTGRLIPKRFGILMGSDF